jgi:hypothetical protein
MIANILIGMAILRELKRRKVLHTLSLYVVGCWVALQVVEVLSDAGLPPGTMRQVLVAMSIGFLTSRVTGYGRPHHSPPPAGYRT